MKQALNFALKSNPSPIYHSSFSSRITVGNLTDDIAKISTVDWIIEVVVENLEIKKNLYDQVEKYRKPGTLVSSNTSGIFPASKTRWSLRLRFRSSRRRAFFVGRSAGFAMASRFPRVGHMVSFEDEPDRDVI